MLWPVLGFRGYISLLCRIKSPNYQEHLLLKHVPDLQTLFVEQSAIENKNKTKGHDSHNLHRDFKYSIERKLELHYRSQITYAIKVKN